MLYISKNPEQGQMCACVQWPEAESEGRKYLKMCKKEGDTDKELNSGSSSGTDTKSHQRQGRFDPKICL